jgi:hypothetical protein
MAELGRGTAQRRDFLNKSKSWVQLNQRIYLLLIQMLKQYPVPWRLFI